MAKTRTGVSNADAREETRKALVAAAIQLLAETGPEATLDSLNVRDICARAGGRTTGSFYGNWSGMADFTHDLLLGMQEDLYLIVAGLDKVASIIAKGFDSGAEPAEVLREAADEDLSELRKNPHWPTQVEAIVRNRGNRNVADACTRGYRFADEITGAIYAELLERAGLRLRPPLTPQDLGVILQALVEGFTLRSLVEPDLDLGDGSLPAYSTAVAMVISAACTGNSRGDAHVGGPSPLDWAQLLPAGT